MFICFRSVFFKDSSCLSIFFLFRGIIHIAKIFLSDESKITGLRFSGGLWVYQAFVKVWVIHFWFLSMFNISALCLYGHGAYFKCSALISSQPALLLFWRDFTAFSISSVLNGIANFCRLMWSVGVMLSFL